MAEDRVLAMFPLESTVLPGTAVPLNIFEPRYRALIRAVLDSDHQQFGIAPIERGREVGGGDQRCNIGVVVTVVEANELPDGRFTVVAIAGHRLGVTQWLPDDPFPQALVADRTDIVTAQTPVAVGTLEGAFDHLVDLVVAQRPSVRRPVLEGPAEDLSRRVWEIVRVVGFGAHDNRRLLELDDVTRRAELAITLVRERTDLLDGLGGQDR